MICWLRQAALYQEVVGSNPTQHHILDQGFPTWRTQKVAKKWSFGYNCISGGTLLMFGGTERKAKMLGTPVLDGYKQ